MIMEGQLRFDEFMNISEEKPQQEIRKCAERRTPMVDPCYYCLCNSCINNAESITIIPNELPDNWEPCFFCDDCRIYDGDTRKKNMEKAECTRYQIDDYHAKENRKKIKLVKGGES